MIATFLGLLMAVALLQSCFPAKITSIQHDMRMEDFEICRKEWNKKEQKYNLKFTRSGDVMKSSGSFKQSKRHKRESHSIIGRWSLSPSGRVIFSTRENGIVERYSAEFQLNPFGDLPRMTKGTIVRDNRRFGVKNLFRRVLASFSAEGTSEDTLDISYKSRASL